MIVNFLTPPKTPLIACHERSPKQNTHVCARKLTPPEKHTHLGARKRACLDPLKIEKIEIRKNIFIPKKRPLVAALHSELTPQDSPLITHLAQILCQAISST